VLPGLRSFNSMDFSIRSAKREDCPAMLELVRELAVFERAPDEVTVSLEHFEESGFGEKPVWWAFVACVSEAQTAAADKATKETSSTVSVQDPLLAHLMQESAQTASSSEIPEVQNAAGDGLPVQFIQLDEPMASAIPEQISAAFPQMQEELPCENVIGFALYYIRYSTWKGRRMYLEDLLVTESWRGKGVGTALMDAMIGAAKAEALHGISWQVLEWNEPAIKFYERYGARFDNEWTNAAIDV
jgi:GNAT superfamily N-acetyltransferase